MALQRVWMPSPCYSSRGGTSPRLLVLHTTEGARTIESLGNWFANPANEVSSHTGADDKPGVIGEYVKRDKKAWTQGDANPYSVAIEQCAFAAWSPSEWAAHPHMLANTAAWIAEEAQFYGIPIRALTPSEAQGGVAGVCQHVDLGSAGGGHTDCGPNFPMGQVIAMAKGDLTGPPEIAQGGDDDMFIRSRDGRVRWFIADGKKSYWRLVPEGMEQDIADRIVDDPNDSWLHLWDH